jgi:hypothetical protein
MILSYFTFSILWAFIGDMPYVECLRSPAQVFGLITLYWWFPGMFYLDDKGFLK